MTKRLNSKFRVCKKLKGIQKNLWGIEKASKFRSVKILKSNLLLVNQKLKGLSTFKKLLNTKQCLKNFYCNIQEKPFQVLIRKALRSKAKTIDKLVSLLESRLDVVLYRAGFVNSLHMARQLINHGFILINSKQILCSIIILKSGNIITLNDKNMVFKKQLLNILKISKLKQYYKFSSLSQNKNKEFKKNLMSILNKKNRNLTEILKKILEKQKKFHYSQKYRKLPLVPLNLEINFKLWKIIFLWDPSKNSVYYPLKLQQKTHKKNIVYKYNEILYND
jgi:small subunit ribosomal protein S4